VNILVVRVAAESESCAQREAAEAESIAMAKWQRDTNMRTAAIH
jgi:hypothetical protein